MPFSDGGARSCTHLADWANPCSREPTMISPCGCVSAENQRNTGCVSAENAPKTSCVCAVNRLKIGVVSVFVQFNEIYDALPGQLGKENKRFVMNALKENARYESFANDFTWLTQSDAALKATCVMDPRPMLERTEQRNRFKLYQSDVGMLMSRYRSTVALAALAGQADVNFGAVYENAVAQELSAAGSALQGRVLPREACPHAGRCSERLSRSAAYAAQEAMRFPLKAG